MATTGMESASLHGGSVLKEFLAALSHAKFDVSMMKFHKLLYHIGIILMLAKLPSATEGDDSMV